MSIWHRPPDIEQINENGSGTMVEMLGIIIVEIGDDFLKGTMPVDNRTLQPQGILHGGASVAFAETLGSIASSLCLDPGKQYCVGLDINANHIRPVVKGKVAGLARPLHIGKTTHVWNI